MRLRLLVRGVAWDRKEGVVKSTTERLVTMLRQRHKAGLKKYGVTVDRTDLKLEDWIQHAIEELLDGAAYLTRIKDNLKESKRGYAGVLEETRKKHRK